MTRTSPPNQAGSSADPGVSRAVCLVSGGLDSCVAAAVARSRGHRLAFLHIDYGQLTERQELFAFGRIADHYQVQERLVVDLGHFATIGGSALTDRSIPIPEGDPDRIDAPATYVPFRNASFLAVATSWAEVLGACAIYLGLTAAGGSPYPDCDVNFVQAFQRLIDVGTAEGSPISLEAPLLHLSKEQIVKRGVELGAPLKFTWSCYRALDRPCGRCDSCLLRKQGFFKAGLEDPFLPPHIA